MCIYQKKKKPTGSPDPFFLFLFLFPSLLFSFPDLLPVRSPHLHLLPARSTAGFRLASHDRPPPTTKPAQPQQAAAAAETKAEPLEQLHAGAATAAGPAAVRPRRASLDTGDQSSTSGASSPAFTCPDLLVSFGKTFSWIVELLIVLSFSICLANFRFRIL